ncbi:hypothetical protein F5B20DRAFT_61567 [Whalleya microplaca]|nr:hypothetical protein F5B20DRAFT_61567 [Whalleya microplaca]
MARDAGKMAKLKPAPAASRRPLNAFITLTFVALSALFAYLMHVRPVLEGVPINFQAQVDAAVFDNGTPLATRYTGIRPLDEVCRFLVVAFLAGPASWDLGVRAQQIHFFGNFFAVVCIWNVEACRRRNAERLISFTALFAILYQTIGAAIIMPLYYAASVYSSSGDAYYTSGREVPQSYALTILPSAVLGYLVPTILMYLPWSSIGTTQQLVAFWQVSFLFVNVLLFAFSFLVPVSTSPLPKKRNTADLKPLKSIYLVAALVSAITHLGTLYTCLTSPHPQLSLRYVFVPTQTTWKDSTAQGLHYIFQWDWWGAYASSLLWCWVAAWDVQRLEGRALGVVQLVLIACRIAVVAVLAGPGAAMAVVWSWREERLVGIEDEDGDRGTGRKVKAG